MEVSAEFPWLEESLVSPSLSGENWMDTESLLMDPLLDLELLDLSVSDRTQLSIRSESIDPCFQGLFTAEQLLFS